MKAWLITWEGTDVDQDGSHVASILSSRYADERVRDYVEKLYAENCFSLEDRARIAKNKRDNPYPAEVPSFPPPPDGPGGRCGGMVHCGGNPFLNARVVTDLQIHRNEDGTETATWTEPPTLAERARMIMELHGLGNDEDAP